MKRGPEGPVTRGPEGQMLRGSEGLVRRGQMLAYGSGNLSVNLLSQAFATFATFYYVDHLGVDPSLIGVAMVIHGIVNAVLNPLVGHVSDRTRTRWGRRVPYIAIGMAPLAAAFTMIWIPLVDGATARFWYFLVVVLVYDVLFVVVVLDYVALFPEMFTTIAERAGAASWRQMFAIVGMIAASPRRPCCTAPSCHGRVLRRRGAGLLRAVAARARPSGCTRSVRASGSSPRSATRSPTAPSSHTSRAASCCSSPSPCCRRGSRSSLSTPWARPTPPTPSSWAPGDPARRGHRRRRAQDGHPS
ncbi:MFS transporter [Microbispora bryophytorum]|uniref:MFS transporter n=1 Tax=Microbispora bryophytorum TaxID=1460882 RepID=A0A8H9H595_9ACTN|nr:MFS transporter [Microbispora bryophytorum]GGO29086.1 hypothetical protein GCM10011574_64140 [Microbispora bryophytorum]